MKPTITLTGRLASQPETKDKGRGPWTRARVAVSQGRYDKQTRQWVDADTPTAWFTVMAGNKTGETLATMGKGDTVMIYGSLTVDEWQPQAGTGPAPIEKRTDLTVWADSVALVKRKQAGQAPGATSGQQSTGYTATSTAAPQQAYPSSSPWEVYNNPDF